MFLSEKFKLTNFLSDKWVLSVLLIDKHIPLGTVYICFEYVFPVLISGNIYKHITSDMYTTCRVTRRVIFYHHFCTVQSQYTAARILLHYREELTFKGTVTPVWVWLLKWYRWWSVINDLWWLFVFLLLLWILMNIHLQNSSASRKVKGNCPIFVERRWAIGQTCLFVSCS